MFKLGHNNETDYFTLVPGVTTGAYSAGQAIGTTIEIDLGTRGNRTLYINRLLLNDLNNESGVCDFYIFDGQPTASSDKSIPSYGASDLEKLIKVGSIAAVDYKAYAGWTNQLWVEKEVGVYFPQKNRDKLYAQCVSVGTPNWNGSNNLKFSLEIIEYA